MLNNEINELQENENEELDEAVDSGASRRAKLKEIKKLLIGNMIRQSDGSMTVGNGAFSMPYGFRDGAMRVIFFGVSRRKYRFETTFRNNTQALYQTAKAMQHIGRLVDMETAPDAAVCYITSPVFRPVVLMLEKTGEEKQLVLRSFCGRSPLAFIAAKRAVSRLEKVLPKQVKRKRRK